MTSLAKRMLVPVKAGCVRQVKLFGEVKLLEKSKLPEDTTVD